MNPAAKLIKADLALERWLKRLIRAAREVRRHAKEVRYYRSRSNFPNERPTPKLPTWTEKPEQPW